MTFGNDDAQAQARAPKCSAESGPPATDAAAWSVQGEVQRWEGRPTPWRVARRAGIGVALQLPLLVGAAAMVWLLLSTRPRLDPLEAAAVAIFTAGIAWNLILPAIAWHQARRLRYMVTDRRLLAIMPGRPEGLWQLPLARIARIERRDHSDGTATLQLFAGGLSRKQLVLPGIDRPDAALAALQAGGSTANQLGVWPVDAAWRNDPAAALLPALEPGERLAWMARPDARASLREIALETLPIAALCLPISALLWWIMPIDRLFASDQPHMDVAGVAFAAVWLGITGPMLFVSCVQPVVRWWRAITSVIAVSDRRVLIAQGWRRIGVRSLHADDLLAVSTLHTQADGCASLRLKVRRRRALMGSDPEFHGVVDAAAGEAAINALLARAA
ncbi:hypothetical protein CAP39_00430 [Sphingomonas sp. IBVSS1]|nr:hypothetical protein CAP39_00430 [Sphingomonas sp. IBVSS1]